MVRQSQIMKKKGDLVPGVSEQKTIWKTPNHAPQSAHFTRNVSAHMAVVVRRRLMGRLVSFLTRDDVPSIVVLVRGRVDVLKIKLANTTTQFYVSFPSELVNV